MNRFARVLLTASLLAAFSASSSATDTGPIDALAAELASRSAAENYGVAPAFGKAVLLVADDQLGDGSGIGALDDNTSPAFLRALPGRLRRMYPAEFVKNTPGDISDLVDAYEPAATDAWRDLLLARADELEALVARSSGCGYHPKPSGLAKLLAVAAKTRRAIPRADAAPTPAARFAKMLAVRPIDARTAILRGLAPPGPADRTECSARLAGRRLAGYDSAEGASRLVAGHLTFQFTFLRRRTTGATTYEYWTYDLRIDADGVAGPGKFDVSAASLSASHGRHDDSTGVSTELDAADYALLSGTIVVTDFCDARLVGAFVVRLKDVSNSAPLSVDKGAFELVLP